MAINKQRFIDMFPDENELNSKVILPLKDFYNTNPKWLDFTNSIYTLKAFFKVGSSIYKNCFSLDSKDDTIEKMQVAFIELLPELYFNTLKLNKSSTDAMTIAKLYGNSNKEYNENPDVNYATSEITNSDNPLDTKNSFSNMDESTNKTLEKTKDKTIRIIETLDQSQAFKDAFFKVNSAIFNFWKNKHFINLFDVEITDFNSISYILTDYLKKGHFDIDEFKKLQIELKEFGDITKLVEHLKETKKTADDNKKEIELKANAADLIMWHDNDFTSWNDFISWIQVRLNKGLIHLNSGKDRFAGFVLKTTNKRAYVYGVYYNDDDFIDSDYKESTFYNIYEAENNKFVLTEETKSAKIELKKLIDLNTLKKGITKIQIENINKNTLKTGITIKQAADIESNNRKSSGGSGGGTTAIEQQEIAKIKDKLDKADVNYEDDKGDFKPFDKRKIYLYSGSKTINELSKGIKTNAKKIIILENKNSKNNVLKLKTIDNYTIPLSNDNKYTVFSKKIGTNDKFSLSIGSGGYMNVVIRSMRRQESLGLKQVLDDSYNPLLQIDDSRIKILNMKNLYKKYSLNKYDDWHMSVYLSIERWNND